MGDSKFCSGGKSDDADNILGARTSGVFLSAAMARPGDCNPRTNVKRAHALGATNFVGGKREGSDPKLIGSERTFSKCLNSIGMEENPSLAAYCGKLCDGLNRPGFVIGVHHRHKRGLRANRPPEGKRIHGPRTVHGKNAHLEALKMFEILESMKNGMVLDGRCDEVLSAGSVGARETNDAKVARLRPTSGENDFMRTNAEESGDTVP